MSDVVTSPVRLDFERVREDAISQIHAFCAAHGFSPSRFGTVFAGDNKLVGDLRRRSVGLGTLLKAAAKANAYADAADLHRSAEARASD